MENVPVFRFLITCTITYTNVRSHKGPVLSRERHFTGYSESLLYGLPLCNRHSVRRFTAASERLGQNAVNQTEQRKKEIRLICVLNLKLPEPR